MEHEEGINKGAENGTVGGTGEPSNTSTDLREECAPSPKRRRAGPLVQSPSLGGGEAEGNKDILVQRAVKIHETAISHKIGEVLAIADTAKNDATTYFKSLHLILDRLHTNALEEIEKNKAEALQQLFNPCKAVALCQSKQQFAPVFPVNRFELLLKHYLGSTAVVGTPFTALTPLLPLVVHHLRSPDDLRACRNTCLALRDAVDEVCQPTIEELSDNVRILTIPGVSWHCSSSKWEEYELQSAWIAAIHFHFDFVGLLFRPSTLDTAKSATVMSATLVSSSGAALSDTVTSVLPPTEAERVYSDNLVWGWDKFVTLDQYDEVLTENAMHIRVEVNTRPSGS
ncbi:hypothetical protein Pelo_12535 [Pelomyxa schiedti]|nr:hypothetical protein Pelo_12535 [Pelomyxa schiedti]